MCEYAELKEGAIVKHFKRQWSNEGLNCLYRIKTIAKDHETREPMVVYEALYDKPEADIFKGQSYVRPLEMFTSLTDKEKYPEAEQEHRFTILLVSCLDCCFFDGHSSSCMNNMNEPLPSSLICPNYISLARS